MRERKMVRKVLSEVKPALVVIKEIIKPEEKKEVMTTYSPLNRVTTVEVQSNSKLHEMPSNFLNEVAKAKEQSYSDHSFLWNLKDMYARYTAAGMFGDEDKYQFQLRYLSGRIEIIKTRLKIKD